MSRKATSSAKPQHYRGKKRPRRLHRGRSWATRYDAALEAIERAERKCA